MVKSRKRIYCLSKMMCPVCYKLVINHLPWELNSCYEKNKVWYDEVLGVKQL